MPKRFLLFVLAIVLFSGFALAQVAFPPGVPHVSGPGGGSGGGPGADCIADGTCLPVDALNVPVVGRNYIEGITLFDATDGTDSTYATSLNPGEIFSQSVADYAGLSLSTHTTNTDGATVSRARLQAFPAVYAGTGPGGRALAGGVTMTMQGDDAAAVSTVNVTVGNGLSFGQGATEWEYLSTAGASFNTGGDPALDFTVATDTDADMIFCDSSANTCLLGSTTATSTGALAIQPTTGDYGLISQRSVDGPFRNYIANTNAGTLAYSSMEWLSDGVGASAITRYSSTYPGTLAGLPNATALDIYTNADMRLRADGGDIAFIATTTPLAYLGAAGFMAGVSGTPDLGSSSLPWDDLYADGVIYDPTGGTIDIGGALTMAQRRVTTTPITVALTDGAIICDTGSNSITLNLPGTHAEGQTFVVVKAHASNTCTLDPSGAELIDGGATYALSALGSAVSITFNVAYGGWFVTSARNGQGSSGGFLPLNANSVAQSLTNYPSLSIDGPLRVPNGSESVPGMSFASDTDSGLYNLGNQLDLVKDGASILSLNNTAGVRRVLPGTSGSSGTVDLGSVGESFADLYAFNIRSPSGATMTIEMTAIDFVQSSATQWQMTSNGDFRGEAISTGTPNIFRAPALISASSGSLPTCAVGYAGGQVYVDDTDDANAGRLCVCRADGGGTYAWVNVDDNFTSCAAPS